MLDMIARLPRPVYYAVMVAIMVMFSIICAAIAYVLCKLLVTYAVAP